jgi:hypothetical protein
MVLQGKLPIKVQLTFDLCKGSDFLLRLHDLSSEKVFYFSDF